jgi:CheY-like chemotaxis protein
MSMILIVDDDPDITELFQIFLTNDGHTTTTAASGRICLDKLQTLHPDVILLDIMMEFMDGWATLANIKNNPKTESIPVIMVTGKPLEERDCERYGNLFYDYLMKPIRRTQLCEAVRGALTRR